MGEEQIMEEFGKQEESKKLKKGARITGDDRERIARQLGEEYEAGASIRGLADWTGRSYGWVHRILRESGVTLRRRGGVIRYPNR